MDTGNGSSTIPVFDSGFPVDFSIYKDIDSQADWQAGSRLQGGKYLYTSDTDSEASSSAWDNWDSNEGFFAASWASSDKQAWMFKRTRGFTTVAYQGNGVAGRQIAHDMNNSVGMMWIKKRDATGDWWVYHSGMTDDYGGGDPEDYANKLNENVARTTSASAYWNGTAPTSTHFTLGSSNDVNQDGNEYLAMLFSSVDKISKAGYYLSLIHI